jgi:hypothetical protein
MVLVMTWTATYLGGVALARNGTLLERDKRPGPVGDSRSASASLTVLGSRPCCVLALACSDADLVGHTDRSVRVGRLRHEIIGSGWGVTAKTERTIRLGKGRGVEKSLVSRVEDLILPSVTAQFGRITRTWLGALSCCNFSRTAER